MSDLKLTVLIENSAPENLIAEHGLSILVETPRTKFIFDCGHTGAAFDNAKTLGVDLSEIKFVALSHSHYDHAGGFPKLLDFAPVEKIFTGKNFWEEKFSVRDKGQGTGDKKKFLIPHSSFLINRGCGFDEKFLRARGIEQIVCENIFELEENVWLVGNFKRRYEFETIPKKFLRGGNVTLHPAGLLSTAQNFQPLPPLERHFVPDDFSDEIILVLRSENGLTVVTACAHSGILNIVADVSARFDLPIRCVIGGLHLTGATHERISRTLDELKLLGVKKILPCHCSGEEFMKLCGEKISTGSVVEIV